MGGREGRREGGRRGEKEVKMGGEKREGGREGGGTSALSLVWRILRAIETQREDVREEEAWR